MIGMLADLSDDCLRFVRLVEEREADPIRFARRLEDFMNMLEASPKLLAFF